MKTQELYSWKDRTNRRVFSEGMRDGIPIGLGYLAVAFSLGIAARNVGITAGQGFLMSLLCNASAGEYAGITLIAAGASLIEAAVMTFVVNARYLLMSCAMSQRMQPGTSLVHRLAMAFDITDELFGIAISRPGYLNPYYTYGAVITAAPGWAIGTALGCIAGNIMPERVVSALSVALFGMFLAVIIPPAKKDKVVAVLIVLSFAASYAASVLPGISSVSGGTRTIVLTIVLAAGAAILFPKKQEEEAA
ncbi:MAG: AzlC family ABC transporter permease [Clostridiales bacterium]|nr:AzlC family ABC transporter permease [Clostridiales bacterium]